VVHSTDNQEVGVAHEVKSPENEPQFSQTTMMGQYWLGPNKLSDQPKMLSKTCHGILKKVYLTEFSTDAFSVT